MTEFEYIAFDIKSGRAIAYGRHTLDVYNQLMESQAVAGHPGDPIPSYDTLFCGKAGPYIWAEKLNLRRAMIVIDTHITTHPVASNIPVTAT